MATLMKVYDENEPNMVPFEWFIDNPLNADHMKEIWSLIEKEKESNDIWNYDDLNEIITSKLKEFGYIISDVNMMRYNY